MVNMLMYPEKISTIFIWRFNLVDANAIAKLYSHVYSLQLFASRVSSISSSSNRTVKWRFHRHSRELIAAGEERKYT
jgi:hypothetical protein